jgi:hypothetical protein
MLDSRAPCELRARPRECAGRRGWPGAWSWLTLGIGAGSTGRGPHRRDVSEFGGNADASPP